MTFEEMKKKADELKAKRDKALGAIEQIEAGWMERYGTKDPKEIKKKLEELRIQLDEVQNEYMTKMEEVEKLLGAA